MRHEYDSGHSSFDAKQPEPDGLRLAVETSKVFVCWQVTCKASVVGLCRTNHKSQITCHLPCEILCELSVSFSCYLGCRRFFCSTRRERGSGRAVLLVLCAGCEEVAEHMHNLMTKLILRSRAPFCTQSTLEHTRRCAPTRNIPTKSCERLFACSSISHGTYRPRQVDGRSRLINQDIRSGASCPEVSNILHT